MKGIIEVDVPGWQIGQEATVYFKDTMQTKGVCRKEQIVRCGDCKYHGKCEIADGFGAGRDWFCADGERNEKTF